MIELREYVDSRGVSPFAVWRGKLDPAIRSRVTIAVFRLATGNFSAVKGAGGGIFELRMDFGPGYRVYFGKDGERLVIQRNVNRSISKRRRHSGRSTGKESGTPMANTRSFSDTVKADLEKDRKFRRALLSEAVACMVSGDVETGKIVLREYVNGTVGFLTLGAALGRSPKSLMRMLSPAGNPQARNLFEMVAYLQKAEGTVLEIRASNTAA